MPVLVAELRVHEIVGLETLVHRRMKLESIGLVFRRGRRILLSNLISAAATSFFDVDRRTDRVILVWNAPIVLGVFV